MSAGQLIEPFAWVTAHGVGFRVHIGAEKPTYAHMWDPLFLGPQKDAPDLLAERDRLKAANAEFVEALEFLIDVWDDSEQHPDYHCYIEGAWKLALDEARAALTKNKEVTK